MVLRSNVQWILSFKMLLDIKVLVDLLRDLWDISINVRSLCEPVSRVWLRIECETNGGIVNL
jgi:hypothetical protein